MVYPINQTSAVMIGKVINDKRLTMTNQNKEQYFEDTMYGTYADILFILFPFLVIFLLRIWNNEGIEILKQPDLSIAAAILAGLSLGKFVLGLIGDRDLGQYKERIVFFMALTLFLVLGPSLMIIIKIINDNEAAKFVVYAQPVLLTIAIAIYSSSVSIHKIVEQHGHNPEDDSEHITDVTPSEPLNIKTDGKTND